MLSPLYGRSTCTSCRFCCSFKRSSLWETPIFTIENIEAIKAKHPEYLNCLETYEKDGTAYAQYSLSGQFTTDHPTEEVPCPFLDTSQGCILSDEEKPWDCKIWPLRVIKPKSSEPYIALTPTCPAVNALEPGLVKAFVKQRLAKDILQYAKMHPHLCKDASRSDFLKKI